MENIIKYRSYIWREYNAVVTYVYLETIPVSYVIYIIFNQMGLKEFGGKRLNSISLFWADPIFHVDWL